MRSVTIGRRTIGDRTPCYVIAEAGSNHDGDLDQACRLIDVAAEAGARRLSPEGQRILALENETVAGHTCKVIELDGPLDIDRLRTVAGSWLARFGDEARAP